MMKKIVLFFVGICGFAGIISAQTVTNTRILQQASVGFKLSMNTNYAKAVSMARSKGWALTLRSKNGNKAYLVGVDQFGLPQYVTNFSNLVAANTTGASRLWPGGATGLNLSGSSANMKNKLGIWDGGLILASHVELIGRITQKDNPTATDDHATHTTGTMIATGINPQAKGMAYGTQGIIAYDYLNNSDFAEIANEAPNLILSNHSYGAIAGWFQNSNSNNRWEFWGNSTDNEDYHFGYYDSRSQLLDSIAYNAPNYLMVRAAGNNRNSNGPAVGQPYFRYNASGTMASAGNRPGGISSNDSYDILPLESGAKNILTIGAVSGIPGGYSKADDIVMTSFSSWGPTDDGRIKPDLVADGVNVLSTIDASNNSYAILSGTSMASPNATGSLFLLQEYYSKLKAGAFMRAATLKGLAIHTANEAGFDPGPDYIFGWGLLNVEKAAAVITAAVPSNNATTSNHLLFENTLAQGQSSSINVVASGKGQLQATISWTDPKGPVDLVNVLNNRTKRLVNDLDIRVTTGSGAGLRTFRPWTLNVDSPSLPAVPGDNISDNVERIDIDSTVPGQTYTITVSHKGTLARGSQAYSLIVSGVGGTVNCASASGGGGARIDSVSFNTIRVGNSAGSKTYTDNTKYITDMAIAQTIPIAVKVSTADATTNPRIVKVFIDYNNNGTFEVGELASTSTALSSATQIYNGTVAVPNNLTVGNIYLMRIVVQETSVATDVAGCGAYGKGETQDYRVKAVGPTNDLTISELVSPIGNDCSSGAQYVTVRIRNNGSASISNIPLTVAVGTGGTTVANLSFTYPGPILGLSSSSCTFQTPLVTLASTNYTITATVSAASDLIPGNNSLIASVTTNSKPTVTATGEICGTTANLKVTNADGNNYFWYSTPTGTVPFSSGASTSTIFTTGGSTTYYVAKEAKVSIGPLNRSVFPQGSYNNFNGNYVKINNSVPVTLETVRLYIGNPGQLKITLADLISEDATTGSYRYQPLGSTTLDVYPTSPAPIPGPGAQAQNVNDTGAIYNLNLPVLSTGDHIMIFECLPGAGRSDSATIFRNNNIVGTGTYPIGVSNIMTITGNAAHTGGAVESQYYYFLYDMKVKTIACPSDRIAVIATTAPIPTISQVADSLVSTIATGNQWYLNDTLIAGATTNHYKPTKAGKYKVFVTTGSGCQQISNVITFAVTATIDVLAREINLNVSPNPNNGVFNLSFEVTGKADLTIDILSASGQNVFNNTYPNFTGKFAKQMVIENVSSEFYILQIQHNKKTYVQKLLIQH